MDSPFKGHRIETWKEPVGEWLGFDRLDRALVSFREYGRIPVYTVGGNELYTINNAVVGSTYTLMPQLKRAVWKALCRELWRSPLRPPSTVMFDPWLDDTTLLAPRYGHQVDYCFLEYMWRNLPETVTAPWSLNRGVFDV